MKDSSALFSNTSDAIEFIQITRKFGKGKQTKNILENIDLTLQKGQCTLLTGKNGSGKSTLLRVLAGLIKPDSTMVKTNQQLLKWKQARKYLRRNIMYLYQEPYMFDGTVSRNLSYALDSTLSSQQSKHKIKQALEWADLEHRETTSAKCLSGGEKQRLALAQAWLKQPPILLLDEPTANMDKHSKRRTGDLFSGFKEAGTTLLIASHDLDHLLHIMDRRLILQNGQLFESDDGAAAKQ